MTTFFSSSDAPASGPQWLAEKRAAAIAALADIQLPTAAEEIWRYSRIDDLKLDRFHLPSGASPHAKVPAGLTDLLEAVGERAVLLATADGVLVRSDVDETLAAKGLIAGGSDVWRNGEGFDAIVTEVDAFDRLNVAYGAQPLVIDIPAGLYVEKPIVVLHWIGEAESAVFPRTVVRAGENSEATVVEYFASVQGSCFVAPVTELDLSQAANLRYVNVQRLGSDAWQIAHQVSRVERDATLSSTSVALGGHYARVRTDCDMVGLGSNAKLQALYFGNADQMHDFRTLQRHQQGKSTSDLLFKGALGDTARSVYSGLIHILKGAGGTNAFQTNRNLILSNGAHADSVPNLEIEENDVACSHASAVGPVDEEQRYYLESRGVPAHVADRLIVLGFLDEILAGLPVEGLHQHLRNEVVTKLDHLDESRSLLA